MTSQTDAAQRRYDEPRGRNYRIDMTRGKPSPEQAELSNPVLTILDPDDCLGTVATIIGITATRRVFPKQSGYWSAIWTCRRIRSSPRATQAFS